MSIEAMKQALEALELWLNHKLDEDTAWQAHTSIRQAITEAEKQEQGEPVAWRFTGIAGLKRFISQKMYEAQTPATKKWYEPFKCANCTTPQPKQEQGEPVAIHQYRNPHCSDWYDGIPDHHDGHGPYEVRTLYTTPQQRKPLTDAEIDLMTDHIYYRGKPVDRDYRIGIFRQAEAAHHIKE
jgi:hypothetical protein